MKRAICQSRKKAASREVDLNFTNRKQKCYKIQNFGTIQPLKSRSTFHPPILPKYLFKKAVKLSFYNLVNNQLTAVTSQFNNL